MIPRPPTWIKTRMTSCPKVLRALPVSTTTSPVTQLADTAVKSASTNLRRPIVDAAGSISSTVPREISVANANMETLAGDRNIAFGENI